MADTDNVVPYVPNDYPVIPGGEPIYITDEFSKIRSTLKTMQEVLALLEARIVTEEAGAGTTALVDGATPALDAAEGPMFTLTAAGDRTIAVPTNAVAGRHITIAHTASGANRTLALNTGAGGFRFGTDITGLTITTSGLTDYIGAVYNDAAGYWDVISYVKGY